MSSAKEIRDADGFAIVVRKNKEKPKDKHLAASSAFLDSFLGEPMSVSSSEDIMNFITGIIGSCEPRHHSDQFNGIGVRLSLKDGLKIFRGDGFKFLDPRNFKPFIPTGVEIGMDRGKGIYIEIQED